MGDVRDIIPPMDEWYSDSGTYLDWRGSYLGFTYNGKHSTQFRIVRVSSGGRYDEQLTPTMQDKTAQTPGADGTYYFGSYYTQKQFSVNYAFDGLTDAGLRELKEWFGDKKIHDLIFDENPYKIYSAKVTGASSIKHLAFDEGIDRIYKGEGTVQFTCYYPFARSNYKFLNQYTDPIYDNINEWKAASRMANSRDASWDVIVGSTIQLFNPGDLPTDFILKIPKACLGSAGGSISIPYDSGYSLSLKSITLGANETHLVIDTKRRLIYGIKSGNVMGNIYNERIGAGDFFKINTNTGTTSIRSLSLSGFSGTFTGTTIEYDYLYF